MRAIRAYRVLHAKGGVAPSRFAGRDRFDQVEVVEIASGETILLWDVPARDVRALLRTLRADLAQLDEDAFIARWRERDELPPGAR
jgi:hypothetical protein